MSDARQQGGAHDDLERTLDVPLAVRAGLAGLAVLTGAGCARPALTRIHDPAQRFAGPGFSVGVPAGAEWYIVPPAPGRVHFMKRVGTEPVPTIYAAAWAADVDARPARAEELVATSSGASSSFSEGNGVRDHPDGGPGRPDPRRRVHPVGAAGGGAEPSQPGAPREGPPDDHARRGLPPPGHSRRIVTVGYSERRVKGTPSLLAPGQPLVEEGETLIRSLRMAVARLTDCGRVHAKFSHRVGRPRSA